MKKLLSILLSVSMIINFVDVRISSAASESAAEDRVLKHREWILEHSKQSKAKTEEETQKHNEENLQSLSTKSDVAKKGKSKKESLTLKSAFQWGTALLAGGFAATVSFVLGKRNSQTELESLRQNKIKDDLNTCREVCDAESYKQGLNSAKQLVEVDKNELEQQLNTNLKNAEEKANSSYNDGYAESYLVGKNETFTFFDNKRPDFLPALLKCLLSFKQNKVIGVNCLENVVDSVDLQSVYEFYNAISDKPYDY